MEQSPFIDDPRDLLTRHISLAVDSPIEAVRAFHIGAAQHQAEVAKGSGLDLRLPASSPAIESEDVAQHRAQGLIRIAMICLAVAIVGMVAMALTLLRS